MRRSFLIAAGLSAAALGAAPGMAAARCAAAQSAKIYPGENWDRDDPAALGWSKAGLDAAWARANGKFSAGMLVVSGKIVSEFGNTSAPYETRSMRKAFLSAVIGQLVSEKKLRLDATLGELGIDDVTSLNEVEKSATVRDLLTSRSGVYLPAAYVVPGDAEGMPPRGAHKPGEAFFYWNWGFNALGGVVEKVTGRSVFELIDKRLARPLAFQDFSLGRDTRYRAEAVSKYPAYLVDLSTRDRARVGLLYLNQGCWRGHQLVSRAWVQDSIAPHTSQDEDFDYGYLWWSTEPPKNSGLKQRLFMARGFANQYILGMPELDAVFLLSVDMSNPEEKMRLGLRPPRRSDFEAVFNEMLKARPRSPAIAERER